MKNIKVGPILGIESDMHYTIVFSTDFSAEHALVTISGTSLSCEHIGDTKSSRVWRCVYTRQLSPENTNFIYAITIDGEDAQCRNGRSSWQVYVPGSGQEPKIAYTSCNGFSSFDLMHKTKNPYMLWDKMAKKHEVEPFSLLIMGGDQLYADSIWSTVPELKKWGELSEEQKQAKTATIPFCEQVDTFYDKLYQERWTSPSMSLLLATIPSVMMWDDHDIFDGWGSYPKELHESAVFQQIFKTAKHYFELFQIRSTENNTLLSSEGNHYAFSFPFRKFHILGLDNRAERTLAEVMSKEQWSLIISEMQNIDDEKHLLVLSGVPVVYRDFSFTESVFEHTPWEEELTDDLKDHWRAKEHQGERARLIQNLLAARQEVSNAKTVILSGDVHIGCVGVIRNIDKGTKIHQIVSSGIVHPAPSRLQWIGIMAVTNDKEEHLGEDRNIHISMLTPFGSDRYIRSRNYVTLEMGTDNKLWVNWESEGKDNPYYPIN